MKSFLVVLLVLLFTSLSLAQLSNGKMAISTAIGQKNELGGSYALSESMRLNAGFGFVDSKTFGTNYSVDVSLWLYKSAIENVTYFYGGGVNYSKSLTKTLQANILGGAEYWFNSRFAWGAYTGLYVASVDNFGSRETQIGTIGVRTTLSWWFN